MSETLLCDDKEQLVAYLYDELDGLTRRRLDEHLRVCAACASEIEALTGVRRELADWAPPDAVLGFTIVSTAPQVAIEPPADGASALRPRRWQMAAGVPWWAQTAAAVLVVAAGLSIANLQVRYGADGLLITTGWMSPVAPGGGASPAATTAPTAAVSAAADWEPALAALESTLREEIRSVRTPEPATPAAAPRSSDPSLQRVAELIRQSERRQQQELALRLAQFGRDLEVQRRSDLVRINQGFGQFEGRAGAEIARQRQMIDYIMRVSSQPPQ